MHISRNASRYARTRVKDTRRRSPLRRTRSRSRALAARGSRLPLLTRARHASPLRLFLLTVKEEGGVFCALCVYTAARRAGFKADATTSLKKNPK